MRGLELSEKYYGEYADELFSGLENLRPLCACGMCGSGSECYGYDDAVSKDHDFEPGFCVFIPDDESVMSRRDAFLLERAYAKLPDEFMGFRRQKLSPVGGDRHGVFRIGEFFTSKIGVSDCVLTTEQWFSIPDYALSEATNGRIFEDNLGKMTGCRAALLNMPEDVRLKKIAGALIVCAQSGQYNYGRCILHGEKGAAQLALFEFADSCSKAVFLLNRTHRPFYKWRFRAMKGLERLGLLGGLLESLLLCRSENDAEDLLDVICGQLTDEVFSQGLSDRRCSSLEELAYEVNSRVSDGNLRNSGIFYGA